VRLRASFCNVNPTIPPHYYHDGGPFPSDSESGVKQLVPDLVKRMVYGVLEVHNPTNNTRQFYTLFNAKGLLVFKVESHETCKPLAGVSGTGGVTVAQPASIKRAAATADLMDDKPVLYAVDEPTGNLMLYQYRFDLAGTVVSHLLPETKRCVELYSMDPLRVISKAYLLTWSPNVRTPPVQTFIPGAAMAPIPKHPDYRNAAVLFRKRISESTATPGAVPTSPCRFEYLLVRIGNDKIGMMSSKRQKSDVDRAQTAVRAIAEESVGVLDGFLRPIEALLQDCYTRYVDLEDCYVHVIDVDFLADESLKDALVKLPHEFESETKSTSENMNMVTPESTSVFDIPKKLAVTIPSRNSDSRSLEWISEPIMSVQCTKAFKRVAETLCISLTGK
jgi:hypothetical protein